MLVFLLFADQWSLQPKIWWKNDKLREGTPNPIQSWVAMEIKWKLYCQVMATNVPIEKKEELKNLLKWGKFSFYVIVDCKIVTYLKNKE